MIASTIIFAVNLFAAIKGIPLHGLDNCTYRKTDLSDAQPDVSYYIEENTDAIPWGTSIKSRSSLCLVISSISAIICTTNFDFIKVLE